MKDLEVSDALKQAEAILTKELPFCSCAELCDLIAELEVRIRMSSSTQFEKARTAQLTFMQS